MSVTLKIDKTIGSRKKEILEYLNFRAQESLVELTRLHGSKNSKILANESNRAVMGEKDRLTSHLLQLARQEKWTNGDILPCVLMLRHCANCVMLQNRNSVWEYEYMAFSRRIGEIWEPFVKDCFEYPAKNGVSLYVPPLFEDVRKRLVNEIKQFINSLKISSKEKASLISYYNKVWSLVTSGDIQLALDIHFSINSTRFAVDCKSGFGSNEKGNTNRLLLVASIYKNIELENYRCVILVRSAEDENNHYLETLKKSNLWEVYCSSKAYSKIKEFSGFDLKNWINKNINWKEDLDKELFKSLKKNKLDGYLKW